MELFYNRSDKNLNLAALKDRENLHPAMAARLRFLSDQVFFTHLKRKIWVEGINRDLKPTALQP
jgi:hypothetical protein